MHKHGAFLSIFANHFLLPASLPAFRTFHISCPTHMHRQTYAPIYRHIFMMTLPAFIISSQLFYPQTQKAHHHKEHKRRNNDQQPNSICHLTRRNDNRKPHKKHDAAKRNPRFHVQQQLIRFFFFFSQSNNYFFLWLIVIFRKLSSQPSN